MEARQTSDPRQEGSVCSSLGQQRTLPAFPARTTSPASSRPWPAAGFRGLRVKEGGGLLRLGGVVVMLW